MAHHVLWTDETKKVFKDWFDSKPTLIQEMIKKHPPNIFYRLKTTGQRVVLHSYDEDGTVKIHVLTEFNPETMIGLSILDKTVFGINPNDLEECDGPNGYLPKTV